MKIIKPYFEILTPIDGEEILRKIELAARTCYKSEEKTDCDSHYRLVYSLIERGHETPLEHVSITVKIVCDRGVMAELTRHRLASFNVESTRYCNYSKDKFGEELTFVEPCFWNKNGTISDPDATKYMAWQYLMGLIEDYYIELIRSGATPEQARTILPNSLKTEVIMTANLREWRHILKLRTSKTSHPQMREIMMPLLKELKSKIPIVFDDINTRGNWDA